MSFRTGELVERNSVAQAQTCMHAGHHGIVMLTVVAAMNGQGPTYVHDYCARAKHCGGTAMAPRQLLPVDASPQGVGCTVQASKYTLCLHT